MHYHRHFTPVVPGADFVFTMLQEMFFLLQNMREALQKQGNGTVAVVVLEMPFAVSHVLKAEHHAAKRSIDA